jgi:hypothetical protein
MKMANLKLAGSVHRATVEGFKKMLVEANRVAADGYELISVVPLEQNRLGCVFKRVTTNGLPPNAPHDSFFE